MNGYYAKYLKFKQKKILDSDPNVRWCPRPGCEKYVRSENSSTVRIVCSCG
jgi:hypothetical protein